MLSSAYTTLLDGNFTNNYQPFYEDNLFLQSYSLDPDNYFAYDLAAVQASQTSKVSGYFQAVSVVAIPGLANVDACVCFIVTQQLLPQ